MWGNHRFALTLMIVLATTNVSAKTAASADVPPLPAGAAANAEGDYFGRTPLMFAAFRGNTAEVQALLDHGAEVNTRDKNGMTALMWTAPRLAPLLLKSGADPRARDKFGRTALDYAAVRDDDAMVGALLSVGMKVDDPDLEGLTPLFFALYATCWIGRSGISPANEVVLMVLTRTLHEHSGAYAASLLLRQGAKVNARDNVGRTPLIFFAEHQMVSGLPLDRQLVSELLAKGANINAQDHGGSTALMQRAHWGDAPMAEFLLEHGADVDARDRKGWTAVIYGAGGQTDHPDAVKALLAHGAKVDTADQEGKTALWYAAQHDNGEIVRVLKQAGAKE